MFVYFLSVVSLAVFIAFYCGLVAVFFAGLVALFDALVLLGPVPDRFPDLSFWPSFILGLSQNCFLGLSHSPASVCLVSLAGFVAFSCGLVAVLCWACRTFKYSCFIGVTARLDSHLFS